MNTLPLADHHQRNEGEPGTQRLAIVAALEALEDGDHGYAAAILGGALEDGPSDRPHVCEKCSATFEWPGILDDHERRAHPGLPLTSPLPAVLLVLAPDMQPGFQRAA